MSGLRTLIFHMFIPSRKKLFNRYKKHAFELHICLSSFTRAIAAGIHKRMDVDEDGPTFRSSPAGYVGISVNTLGRWQSKTPILSWNIDQKSLEKEFSIAICRQCGNRKHCIYRF